MILETDVIRHASWLRGVQTAVSKGTRQLMRCPVHLSVGQEFFGRQSSNFQLISSRFSVHIVVIYRT